MDCGGGESVRIELVLAIGYPLSSTCIFLIHPVFKGLNMHCYPESLYLADQEIIVYFRGQIGFFCCGLKQEANCPKMSTSPEIWS